jgi:hypothetical protein
LNTKYFDNLELALDNISLNENPTHGIKASLKVSLGYLLKSAAEGMKAEYIVDDQEDKANSMDLFQTVLKIKSGSLFTKAHCQIDIRRQEILRTPHELPLEEDIKWVKDHTLDTVNTMLNDEYILWGKNEFIVIRDLIACRLTLYNGRRGGEPARLLLTEWESAENDKWIDPQRVKKIVDPLEMLVAKFKLAYQLGKGSKKLVPVLIPNDMIPAIVKLQSVQ